jgi:chlorophyllase-like protein
MSQESNMVKRLRNWTKQVSQSVTPGPRAWNGAAWGALTALVVMLLAIAYGLFGQTASGWLLIGLPLFVAAFLVAGGLLTLAWGLIKRLPAFYVWIWASALLVLVLLALIAMSVALGVVLVGGATLSVASLLGAGIAAVRRGGWARLSRARRVLAVGGLGLGLAGLIFGSAWLFDAGSPPTLPPNATALSGTHVTPLDLPDPSQPGPYSVRTLFYGSGNDRRRPHYGTQVDLVTQPVDGSPLIEGWSGLRTAYWDFGPDALPRNGRVWYPDGEGVFSLVVILHGQHPIGIDSDPGYTYLGELLASRGFIVVSIDENFLNLSPLLDLIILNDLQEEDDLRGWLLLEHLRLWRDWNATPGNPFYHRVDMDQIALIGHSRGGEAVSIAAAFNHLSHYPDDASVSFDYDFGIRAVVGLAPVDGAYKPAGQEALLEDVSYLVLHGTHDMDVFTFQGLRQYKRVHLTEDSDHFKAAVYIYGANHGQFNTCWGRKDLVEPLMRVFDLEQLMPGEAQRQIAKATIGAFLEATLHRESSYSALFQDLRRGQAWLSDTPYLYQYEDATTQVLCTYEEDVDLTSTTLPGGQLSGERLTTWREGPLEAKWEHLGDQAVTLGWDSPSARYVIRLPAQAMSLSKQSVLVFSLADAGESPALAPIDLTIEVTDSTGETARLPLSTFSPLQPRLEGRLGKAAFMSPFPFSEPVLQHFEFPLAGFVAVNPAFSPAQLTGMSLRFDRTPSGLVALDDLGLRP